MKRRSLLFLSIALSLILLLTGCSGSETAAMDAPMADMPVYDEGSYDDTPLLDPSDLKVELPASNRKLIHRGEISLETKAFDEAVQNIQQLVSDLGGYMEESYIEGDALYSGYGRSARFTCRIPSAQFPAANEALGNVGNVVSKTETAEDVTDQYYDVEAELEALRVQQDRLLAMMEQATEMEDLIALEQALTDVRTRINDRTGTIKRYDGLVQYATIAIDLQEVIEYQEPKPETFADRVRDTFLGSLEFVRDFGEGLVLIFVAVAPFVVVYGGALALLAGAILLLVKLLRRKKAK